MHVFTHCCAIAFGMLVVWAATRPVLINAMKQRERLLAEIGALRRQIDGGPYRNYQPNLKPIELPAQEKPTPVPLIDQIGRLLQPPSKG